MVKIDFSDFYLAWLGTIGPTGQYSTQAPDIYTKYYGVTTITAVAAIVFVTLFYHMLFIFIYITISGSFEAQFIIKCSE